MAVAERAPAEDPPRSQPNGSARQRSRPAPRDRLRLLLLFTPWVSLPLAFLGVASVLCVPLAVLVPFGWLLLPAAVGLAVALGAWLRPRQQIAILDSSHLGVFVWFRRRY